MDKIINNFKINRLIYVLNFAVFFLALRLAMPAYTNSSFLTEFAKEKYVGLIFMVSAFVTLGSLFVLPNQIKRYGNNKITLFLICVNILSLFGIFLSRDPAISVMMFIVSQSAGTLLSYTLDISLEKVSSDSSTGETRGVFLTTINTGWLIAPLVTMYILAGSSYRTIYLIGALILLPMLFLVWKNRKNFGFISVPTPDFLMAIKKIAANKSLRNVFAANFLLQIFYTWMTIYSPILLHNYIGFSWTSILSITAILLLPFVFIQYPLGRLADKYWGEKELMVSGFVLMAISTGLLSFLHAPIFVLWAWVLLLTRIGAATVEVMTEVHFFKQTNEFDTDIISLFRAINPLALIAGPALASGLFYLSDANRHLISSYLTFDVHNMFLVLAAIMLFGIFFAMRIKDSK
jgi:MFS family permease